MQSATVLRDFLLVNPVFTLFLALGCGYLVGRLRIASISLGPVAGALLVSLLLGQFGFKISEGAQSVGFALFIFAVGYQAGPRFFEVIKTQGVQYLLLALFVAGVGALIAILAGKLLDLPFGGMAGLLAGALTTTPTLAAAQEAVRSGLVATRRGDGRHCARHDRLQLRDHLHRGSARHHRHRALAAARGRRGSGR